MIDPDYGYLDQLLHRLALNNSFIADLSFSADQRVVKGNPEKIVNNKHVFVSGLARSGTTTLMRKFHATGQFRSLTYRDMPFVLAPNLWHRLSMVSRRNVAKAERAHGDSILVDGDSPESLDEVFWRSFAGEEYIETLCLKPHDPDDELVRKYVYYVNAIIAGTEPKKDRYLSKNNNNILRLGAIRRAFPHALILIPFREPVQHAYSLLRQHLRFTEIQLKRRFSLEYMTWLGHHEFGLGHRPFLFDGTSMEKCAIDTADYWLNLWCDTYSWLLRTSPQGAMFICYEDLCSRRDTWTHIAKQADISIEDGAAIEFRMSVRDCSPGVNREISDRAARIYSALAARSRSNL